jgi:ABC-2 type transport system permease protein
MNRVLVVAAKEIRQLARSRNVLISAVLFIVIFGGMTAPAVLVGNDASPGQVVDQLLFYLVLVLGIFSGYLFCGQVFLREKQEGVVETLLCSPLSLREIWLGKVVGIVIPATVLSYMASVIIIFVGSAVLGAAVWPSPPVIIHVLAVVPAFIGAGAGLMGFAQLLLGMRENQILNFAIIFGLIFLISFTREILGPSFTVTWIVVASVMVLAVSIILITTWLTRFLSRERIVTTLPD